MSQIAAGDDVCKQLGGRCLRATVPRSTSLGELFRSRMIHARGLEAEPELNVSSAKVWRTTERLTSDRTGLVILALTL